MQSMMSWLKAVFAPVFAAGAVLAAFLVVPAQGQVPPQAAPFGSQEVAFPAKDAAQQLELFTKAANGLAPQRPGVGDVYLLSLSLYDDHVFESEATQAAKILAARFKAEGRTMVLSAGIVDQPRTLPAATPFFINAALGKIAATMDVNEDVLVLFMTSHGNRDGSISLFEAKRMRAMLTGRALRRILDETGIVHRLVIISACFSGAFVGPMANDTSIILTAASSTQTSFGCQPERDWTYFGDAFLNQQMRGGAPLLQAFEGAKATILQWEQRDGFAPSNPQRSVGVRTGPLLAALGQPAAR
jgi:hypothetical protein